MKNIKLIISLFTIVFFIGCSNQDDIPNVDGISAPANISALMTIKQDNSGKVTILPKGEGVSQFEIYFGDGTLEPGYVSPGGTIQHTYAEGTYDVKIVGMSLNGKKTEAILLVLIVLPLQFPIQNQRTRQNTELLYPIALVVLQVQKLNLQ